MESYLLCNGNLRWHSGKDHGVTNLMFVYDLYQLRAKKKKESETNRARCGEKVMEILGVLCLKDETSPRSPSPGRIQFH